MAEQKNCTPSFISLQLLLQAVNPTGKESKM